MAWVLRWLNRQCGRIDIAVIFACTKKRPPREQAACVIDDEHARLAFRRNALSRSSIDCRQHPFPKSNVLIGHVKDTQTQPPYGQGLESYCSGYTYSTSKHASKMSSCASLMFGSSIPSSL